MINFNPTNFEVLLALSLILLIIGLYGLITKRSAIKVIMALEFLVSAPNIVFIAIGYCQNPYIDPKTQSYVIISLSLGAAVVALALAFLRNLYKHFGTTKVNEYTNLKG